MLANQTGLSDKVVSERHHYASQTKLTAGEAAKLLRKKGLVISAKEVKEVFILLNNREPEWHHSGFYRNAKGSTMGRTFFFTSDQVEDIFNRYSEIEGIVKKKQNELQVKKETVIIGFYYDWVSDYGGNYGKKRNYKVLSVYEGSELNKPRNLTTLSESQFANAKAKAGKQYFGYDEPNVSEF